MLTGEQGMATVQLLGAPGQLDGFNSAARTIEKVRSSAGGTTISGWQGQPLGRMTAEWQVKAQDFALAYVTALAHQAHRWYA